MVAEGLTVPRVGGVPPVVHNRASTQGAPFRRVACARGHFHPRPAGLDPSVPSDHREVRLDALPTKRYSPVVAGDSQFLDHLAGDGTIACDWVACLREADAGIDAKLEACLAKVADAGPYLPLEKNGESVLWRAFELPPSKVRALILGQDPYPDPARATGLSFSTGPGGDIPDSLGNVFRELPEGVVRPTTGDLTPWTDQGVMLLNRALTLPVGSEVRPQRHIAWWSPLAVATMKALRVEAETRPIAALLWGAPAHRMRKYLAPDVEVFGSSHPSPMSVARTAGSEPAFRGSDPFRRVNRWFERRGADPIDWTLVE